MLDYAVFIAYLLSTPANPNWSCAQTIKNHANAEIVAIKRLTKPDTYYTLFQDQSLKECVMFFHTPTLVRAKEAANYWTGGVRSHYCVVDSNLQIVYDGYTNGPNS